MKKPLFFLFIALFSAATFVSAQQKQRVAVLPSVGDLGPQGLILLTDKVREIATKHLPIDDFNILKQDVITKMIGEEELYRSCKEGVCIGDLARKTNANYGARCDVIKFENRLVLKFEIYSVGEDAIFETFTDYNVNDFYGMLAVLEARLPDVFQKMVSASDRALARDRAREQQRQEIEARQEYKPTPQPEPAKPEEPTPSNIPTAVASDRYFTLRYMPVAASIFGGLPAHNLEMGWVWKNGMFLGFDLGGAITPDNRDRSGEVLGLGLNIGKSFEPAPDFDLALGGSLGLWIWEDWGYDYGNEGNRYSNSKGGFNWIGPFVRLRYRIFELSCRVLLGTTEEEEARHYDPYNSDPYNNDYNREPSSSLGAIVQVGLGLHFEGSDRFGQPRNYDDYFVLRYLPVASPVYVSPIAYNIEYGWVLGNGMFMGIDLGGAAGDDFDAAHGGGGFNFGKSFELAPEFNLALGGSLGIWLTHDGRDDANLYQNLFFGPFVRLRYSIFELSYRALIGTKEERRHGEEVSDGLGVSNQVGIGLYFEGKKRHK